MNAISSIQSGITNLLNNTNSQLQNLSTSSALNLPASDNYNSAVPDGTAMFSDVFNNLITNVNQTDAVFQADTIKAAAGELDNPQQLLIDSQKANVSLQLAISTRNKALEAYNSIIGMQV